MLFISQREFNYVLIILDHLRVSYLVSNILFKIVGMVVKFLNQNI